ncbi:hypothetical protein GCM10022214_28860 [Actinomadura miaoliensis]|uniref:Uncharacterized protein n=1 Tax=Actinomadura miaoliensis TaxID=430685 RepID=A0ABP7VNW1_9ACTN
MATTGATSIATAPVTSAAVRVTLLTRPSSGPFQSSTGPFRRRWRTTRVSVRHRPLAREGHAAVMGRPKTAGGMGRITGVHLPGDHLITNRAGFFVTTRRLSAAIYASTLA